MSIGARRGRTTFGHRMPARQLRTYTHVLAAAPPPIQMGAHERRAKPAGTRVARRPSFLNKTLPTRIQLGASNNCIGRNQPLCLAQGAGRPEQPSNIMHGPFEKAQLLGQQATPAPASRVCVALTGRVISSLQTRYTEQRDPTATTFN